jgi:competence ComEA-like helix-hairpin-helix protein
MQTSTPTAAAELTEEETGKPSKDIEAPFLSKEWWEEVKIDWDAPALWREILIGAVFAIGLAVLAKVAKRLQRALFPDLPAKVISRIRNLLTSQSTIDINLANREALETLPGVGAALAGRIIEYRDQNGPFTTVDDIIKVPGIGSAKVDQLRDKISVSSPEPGDTNRDDTESSGGEDSDGEEEG